MDLSSLLAHERRARLAAERLLEMRQADLRSTNAKLAQHARSLTDQIIAKRDEVKSIQNETEDLRDEYFQAQTDLARANSVAEQAEHRLWAALQAVRDGFALFDADDRLITANKAYLTVFDGLEVVRPGILYGEIVEILVAEGIVDPQGSPGDWIARMMARWAADQPEPLVIRLWNGQFIKLVDRRTPDGGTVTLGLNQTEQFRMWAAIEAVPDGFVLYDQDDRMVMCNARYREIYAQSAEAMVPGASFEDILRFGLDRGQYRDALGREDEWLEDRLSNHRRADRSVEQRLGDGRWLRVLEQATPDGGRVGLRVDITSIKEQQAALELERERAEAANRAKSAFLANMSHEIRTPMNGVVGMADLLANSALTPDQAQCVSTIQTSGAALLRILDDILDFSRLEADKLPLVLAPFDLEACLHDVVRVQQAAARNKPLNLLIDFAPDQPVMVTGDGARVRQILGNVIGNAIKFTETGDVRIGVVPGAADTVTITVEDTGIGIPPDKLEHVFGEFNQVEDDRNRRFDGTGLGLAISRQLARRMGGDIALSSDLDRGTRVTLHLPLPAEPGSVTPPVHPVLHRALVLGDPGPARDGVCAVLAQLATAVVAADTMPADAQARAIVFLLSDRDDVERPDWVGPVLLITTAPFRRPAAADSFDDCLSLPLSRRTLAQALAPVLARQASLAPPAPVARTVALRVLAAEDNRTNQLVLRKMLKDAAIDLQVVDDGAAAVAAFQAATPDLIFMDISMPGMDGREAARRIRQLEADTGLRRTPIVAMTAHAMDSDRAEILAAGIDHHLTKPLSRDALLHHIEAARLTAQAST